MVLIFIQVCEHYEEEMDQIVYNCVLKLELKRKCNSFLKINEEISYAIENIRKSKCKLGDSVLIWKNLKKNIMTDLSVADLKIFEAKYDLALKPVHFACYMLTPNLLKIENLLDSEEKHSAINFIENYFSESFMTTFLKFQSNEAPFCGAIMKNNEMTSNEWWKSIRSLYEDLISGEDLNAIRKITTATASAAALKIHGLEENFDRFGTSKCQKLIFLSNVLK